MAKPFKNLVEKMSPESRERIRQRTAQMHSEMALQELRQALHLTQQELADVLQMNQAAISKLEHQSDMYVSTLRRFVAAMGGELRIVAHFPQGDVVVNQFEDIEEQEPADNSP
jgi:transcriptional regulator with XRE-family HTH domain